MTWAVRVQRKSPVWMTAGSVYDVAVGLLDELDVFEYAEVWPMHTPPFRLANVRRVPDGFVVVQVFPPTKTVGESGWVKILRGLISELSTERSS